MTRGSVTKTEQLQVRLTRAQKLALVRLAREAGRDVSAYVLSRALPPTAQLFADLLAPLADPGSRRYGLAALNDWLAAARPEDLRSSGADPQLHDLPLWLQNYVAAMVERAAQRLGISPPAWTREIEPAEEPYFATTLASVRTHLLRASPLVFRRRNLFVDASVGDRV